MPDLADGESVEIQGSARTPYVLKNVGGVYSCSCPAWRNQSLPIDRRTCKHLTKYRGHQAEAERLADTVELPKLDKPADKRAPALLLAHSWDNEQELAGWWMSEKLDGVRAYWDGRQFFSRQGNRFHAPAWFTAALPAMPLDGELWAGRRPFNAPAASFAARTPAMLGNNCGLWSSMRLPWTSLSKSAFSNFSRRYRKLPVPSPLLWSTRLVLEPITFVMN